MQDIYKLTDSKGETRYEMMSGERAQRKNHKREEAKLSNRWLPVELEDVPNDAQIRDVSGRMINASELKGEDEADLSAEELVSRHVATTPQLPVNPPAVDSPASKPAEVVQPLPTVQTSPSVVPKSVAKPVEPNPPGGFEALADYLVNPTKPTWHKGEPATMEDEDLLAVWMEYETDPRKDSDISRDEWNYRQDVRAEYQERVKEADRQKTQAAEAKETLADPQVRQLLTEQAEQGNKLATSMLAVETVQGTATNEPLPIRSDVATGKVFRTYQLVGTTRVAMMTASEAKLLNANMDGEWIYAPEMIFFAKPRKGENGEPKKRQKWRGISGTNLLMLCGSEGLSQTVAKETVKRLTGLDAADSTASVKMSEGRKDDADLPDPGREGWAEFYHTVGEVKKVLGESGHKPEVMALTDSGNLIPVSEAIATGIVPADYVGSAGDKEIGRVQKVISAYRLKFQTMLDEMQDELLKALTG